MEAEAPEVAAQLTSLYGTTELLRAGVVHVTSARRAPDGRRHVIAIGPAAPPSSTDFFLLNLCRARADAILASAGTLRSEPSLSHALQGPFAGALGRYRERVLHKASPPVVAILTRSGELPLEHPVWEDGTAKLVLTTQEVRSALAARLGARAEVVALDGPGSSLAGAATHLDARTATAWLALRGLPLISIEAGPSTSGPLYQPPSVVDELLLSLFEAPTEVELGKALPPDGALFSGLRCVADTARDEASGAWRFQRWLR